MFKVIRVLMLLVPLAVALGCGGGGDQSAEDKDAGAGAGGGGHRESPEPAATTLVVVPAGTTFTIAIDQALSSKTNSPGDPVKAHVVGGIRSGDELVVSDGAAAHGVVAEVEGSGRVSGRAILAMNITSLETVGGRQDVQTAMVEGKLRAEGTKKRDVATIVGGTAAGAVLGEILGDDAKLGAIIGGAAGTGVVLATKGKELNLDPGTQIDLKLVNPMTITVSSGGPGA